MQVGDDGTAREPAARCASFTRPERAVPPTSEADGVAGLGEQAAPPGKLCGFPPPGQVPGRGVAELAGVCAVRQSVQEPGDGGNGALYC